MKPVIAMPEMGNSLFRKYMKNNTLWAYSCMVKNLTDIYKLETSQHVNPHLFLSAFISVPTSAIADMIQGKILFTNIKKLTP